MRSLYIVPSQPPLQRVSAISWFCSYLSQSLFYVSRESPVVIVFISRFHEDDLGLSLYFVLTSVKGGYNTTMLQCQSLGS